MIIIAFLCQFVIKFSSVFSDSDIVESNKYSVDYVPCERGWYYFRNKCYRFQGEKEKKGTTWNDAERWCKDYGADLISIHSQEEQDFINLLILENDILAWIGLIEKNASFYRWNDGSDLDYTNWGRNKPSKLGDAEEDCVHLVFRPLGKWMDEPCSKTGHHMCQKESNPEISSPNMLRCPPSAGGGWKFGKSCYHEVTETDSWENAERFCKINFNGHLLSIQGTNEEFFLEYLLKNTTNKYYWIGIEIQDGFQQKWTSGWHVSTDVNLWLGEKKYTQRMCVAMRYKDGWTIMPCSGLLPFICKSTKETPPVLKPPPIGSYCPKDLHDWRDLGGEYCYSIHRQKVDFTEARSHCQARGGDLVSIHSQNETDILHKFFNLEIGSPDLRIYIGLITVKGNIGQEFGWTDGSVYDYKNWDDKEPNRSEKECVTASVLTTKWRNTLCSYEASGHICSVKKIMPINVVDINVVDETAGCSGHIYLKSVIAVFVCIHLATSFLGVVL